MKRTGPWSPERIDSHLRDTAVPLRLACATASGHPQVLSLWYLWQDGALWCATARSARVVRLVERDPRVGFEVAADAPPYRGVRGRGMASIDAARGADVLGLLLDRYQGGRETKLARWLLARAASEVAIRIEPIALASWDFTKRMTPG